MPSISFEGAKNFSISGGNFGDIAGGVVNYNFGRGFEITRTSAFTEYVGATGTHTDPPFPSRSRHLLAQRRNTGSPPPRARIKSVPHRSESAPVSHALMRLGSPSHSESAPRAPTPPPTPFDQSFPPSPTSSTASSLARYLTPPMECSTHQPDDVNVDLTPLTESLGLNSRLTPNPQTLVLSSVREAQVDAQEQMDARLPATETTRESNVQLLVAPSRAPNTLEINPQPVVPPRSEPNTSANDSSVECSVNRDIPSRLGPPPPLPPRPMVQPVASRTTGALNMAQYRMQNYTESIPRTSSPEPMELERRDSNPCSPRRDVPTRDNTGNHLGPDPSPSAQPQVYHAPSLNMSAQPDIATVPQDGWGPLAGTPTLSTVSELTEEIPENGPHWTANLIEDWADDVEGGEDADAMQEKWRDFQPPVTYTDRRHASQRDHHNQPSLHGAGFHRYGQYTDHPSCNSGFCGVSQHQVPLHHSYFTPYSFSGFSFNPSVSQGHPYGGGVIYVAPWPGIWR